MTRIELAAPPGSSPSSRTAIIQDGERTTFVWVADVPRAKEELENMTIGNHDWEYQMNQNSTCKFLSLEFSNKNIMR